MTVWPDFRSPCPVASALDIVGDKWSLVVLRTIFAGRHRYEYHLTERGADLLPVLQELALWSRRHIEGRWPLPDWFAKGTAKQFYPEQ
jgi:DNA-binding HxlR family transcriptional regulator